jgi:hypothetical protein
MVDGTIPCTGDKDNLGLPRCNAQDVCWNNPRACLYGPVAPWGAFGAFGSSHVPFAVCDGGVTKAAAYCISDISLADANFQVGAGLSVPSSTPAPPNQALDFAAWSNGAVPAGTPFAPQSFGVSQTPNQHLWLGPNARWGSYLQCEPLIQAMIVTTKTVIAKLSKSENDPLHVTDSAGGLVMNPDGSQRTYADIFADQRKAAYECWCKKTPTCFLGIDAASSSDWLNAAPQLATLGSAPFVSATAGAPTWPQGAPTPQGQAIAAAYSLGVYLRRSPVRRDPSVEPDVLYSTLAAIADDVQHSVAVGNALFSAAAAGAPIPPPASVAASIGLWPSANGLGYLHNGLLALEASFNPNG